MLISRFLSAVMKALRAARWVVNLDPHRRQDGKEEEELDFRQQREALGFPPERRVVTAPDGVRLGPAQKLMLEREQEVADCEFEVAKLDYSCRMNEIDAAEQEQEVGYRQRKVDRRNAKLEKITEKEEALAEVRIGQQPYLLIY
jgi:hypothetical protein